MVAELARDAGFSRPISGIGGIETWRDAAEFIAMGAGCVQVCTAVMHRGYGIIDDLREGLDEYLETKGMRSVGELVGCAVPAYRDWGDLDLNYHVIAAIDSATCIGCQLCIAACHDGAHQCIHPAKEKNARGVLVPWVDVPECVGCNLCALVCPVDGCISMIERRHAPNVETWNDRVREGRAHVPGGLDDLKKNGGEKS
jgi:dihydropyrimidine dehydrogenase (NAD+) subunit PreA